MFLLTRILPSVDRPPRGALIGGVVLLVTIELILLTFLDSAPMASMLLLGGFGLLLLARHPEWALALLAAGFPLLEPITIALDTDRPVFYLMRILVIAALAFFLFARVHRPGRLLERVATEPILWLGLALGIVLAVGSLSSASPIYARMKLIHYFMTNLLLMVGGALIACGLAGEDRSAQDRRFDRFLLAITVFALLLAVAGWINLRVQYYPSETRLAVLGINPIWVARITGLGLFSLLALFTLGRIGLLPALGIVAPIAGVLILAGSRGPLVGFALIIIIWGFARIGRSPSQRVQFSLLALAAVGFTFLVMPEAIRERFVQPFTGDFSDFARLALVRIAREAAEQVSLLGIGTGGFSNLLRMGDMRAYPHNIFVEIVIENGLLGFTILIGFLGWSTARGIAGRVDTRSLFAFLAFLFALWNAQFSGDVIGNEWIWLFAGILAGRHR